MDGRGMTNNPGLDVTTLRGLLRPAHPMNTILDRIADHLNTYDGYVAFSGGKDSVATLHLALQVDTNVPVVFFDSGLEYPETYRYITDLTAAWHLNIDIIPADMTVLQILIADGSWDHHATQTRTPDLFDALIAKPAHEAHTRHGPGELWGVRAAESAGRRAAYGKALRTETQHCKCCPSPAIQRLRHGGLIRRQDGTIAYGPIWDWSTEAVWVYLQRNHIPPNPVYAKLEALGAPEASRRVTYMIDANHLEHGRAVWLKRGWPTLYQRLCQYLPRLTEWV